MSINKQKEEKLLRCLADISDAARMARNVNGNSYIIGKVMKVCENRLEILVTYGNCIENDDYGRLLDGIESAVEKADFAVALDEIEKLKRVISSESVFKVAFMPYKASMWDSLESIWMAADKDKRCEAAVVPITYYELGSDGKPVRKVNERDDFPEYVPCLDDDIYSLEDELPDIIYIHNPYDDFNKVTRVESRYYSYNLKKYCRKLVYIPYHKWVDGVSIPSFRQGMYIADYSVMNSVDAVERYVNTADEYAEFAGMEISEAREVLRKKFINLGSPEVDKVVSMNEDTVPLPDEWRSKISKSRVNVLYNTTLDEILRAGNLDKVKETLDFVKDNSDRAFVIWRPHPLTRQTIVSMLPDLLGEYDELVDEFTHGDYGVFDNNASMYYAMFWTDMYYGFNTSSLTELYKYTGKIVLDDAPGLVKVDSTITRKEMLSRLSADNVLSEPECSLADVVGIVSENPELKKGKHLIIENSGERINDYMLNALE